MLLSKLISSNFSKMIVFDIRGTIIQDNSIVNNTLYDTIKLINPYREIDINERKNWKGLTEKAVLCRHIPHYEVENAHDEFERLLRYRYINNPLNLVDNGIYDLFLNLRKNGFKVTLNTNLSTDIQLIKRFSFDGYIDDYIAGDKVNQSRPCPHMIEELMKRNNIEDSQNVIKVGDTVNDIKEAKFSNCGISIGVLSGEGNYKDFEEISPDYIFENIIELEKYL